jgi:hypothetical protein
MIISRMKAGWLMIGGAIFLFVLTDMLPNSPNIFSGFETVLLLASIGLMVVGIYFVRTSKPCRICGETVGRDETKCRYCGHRFKNEPAATSISKK